MITEHINDLKKHSAMTGKKHSHNSQIARIDLVFDNRKMLQLLRERGYAIKCKNKEEIISFESEIHEFMH